MLVLAVAVAVAVVPAAAQAKTGKFGTRVLKMGSHGHDVRVLQGYLTKAGFATTVDGQFGSGTQRTVRAWETDADRKVDGKVTRPDAKALRAQVSATPKSLPRTQDT